MTKTRSPRTALLVIVILSIAFGLAACGGGDDDSGATTTAGAGSQGQAEGAGSKQGDGSGNGDGKAGSGGSGGGSGKSGGSGSDASDFTPRQHDDSGGGSGQFRVKGGDNSVQEFGAEADASQRDAAATALHNFLDARAEGNWAAACDYMAKSVVESFEKLAAQAKQIDGTSCAGILETLTNPAAKKSMKAEAKKADVGSLRVEGDRAFVIYTGLGGTILAMPMADEDGDWKVASLAGTPLN